MANKRMFSLSVVDTDSFLEMPISSRLLYYELGMRADDDGFIDNWKKILMFTGLKEDDLKLLIVKNFIIPFESGVIVIRHWRLNNYLRNDRFNPTNYQEEYSQLTLQNNNVYELDTSGIPGGIHSIDKNSIDKNSINKITTTTINNNSNSNSNSNIYDFIESNFGRTLTPIEYEKISEWEDNELTRYAIKQSVLNGVRKINYIESILNSYKSQGIESVLEAQEQEEKFKSKNNKKLYETKKTSTENMEDVFARFLAKED